jgi:hypothetical protein
MENSFYNLKHQEIRLYDTFEGLEKFFYNSTMKDFSEVLQIMSIKRVASNALVNNEQGWSEYLKINIQAIKVTNPIFLVEKRMLSTRHVEAWHVIIGEKIGWIMLGEEHIKTIEPFKISEL